MEKEITEHIRDLDFEQIKRCLLLKGQEQDELFRLARQVRDTSIFGKNVELRSVIEVSNYCRQACRYCGIKNKSNKYILSKEEIIQRIEFLVNLGRRTILIQSGEFVEQDFIDNIAYCCSEAIRKYPDIRFILCMGNLSKEQYKQLKDAGVKRYILKFETSNPEHHHYCRPKDTLSNRIECIQTLINLGFQVGTGNIIGLPKQTIDDLVNDLIFTTKFKLSMVSATKFIPSKTSEFKDAKMGDINLTLNFIALLRILHPECLIPATSSLEMKNKSGQLMGLLVGCNTLTIHDGTPKQYEKDYPIYKENRFKPTENYCNELIKQAGMTASKYII